MRKLTIAAIAFALTGCATAKIDKAYDEGFAKGSQKSIEACTKTCNADMEILGEVNEQLRRKLHDCQFADRNK